MKADSCRKSGRMSKYTGRSRKNKNMKGFLVFLLEKKMIEMFILIYMKEINENI
jgi:hypothetical protein